MEIKDTINTNDYFKIYRFFEKNICINLEYINKSKFDILIYCIKHNISFSVIELIVKRFYTNLNYETDNKEIPFFLALEYNRFNISKFLLSAGADINYCNSNGENALFYLLSKEKLHRNSLVFLLNHNIKTKYNSPHHTKELYFLKELIKKEKLNLIQNYVEYIDSKINKELISELIHLSKAKQKMSIKEMNEILINSKRKFMKESHINEQIFAFSISKNNLGIIKYFYSLDINFIKNYFIRNNVLPLICKGNQLDVIKFAVDKGSNVNEKDEKTGDTALMILCQNENLEAIDFLIKQKADVNLTNNNNKYTALMYGCELENFEITKYLIENSSNINDKDIDNNTSLEKDNKGNSIIFQVYSNKHIKLLKYLINHGADINIQDKSGNTLLYLVYKERNVSLFKYLIDHKANVNISNNNGFSIIHDICKNDDNDLYQYILQHQHLQMKSNNRRELGPIPF
ncbi:ankyrin [Neocallimastix californiae]|uniref:Ankyrin n=1 Tax=Neocallimastix californiae TaxID=1754190 RepID=A0A1Y2DMI4_9FUNG|nr:ankyrin [Neocallimastix californiae]|eukprot:ORY60441.1 ankyrin [Neocallimastix californiae]